MTCDLVMMNDVSGSLAMRAFERIGAVRVFDPERVVLVADHFVPAKDVRSAELAADLRRFAQRYGIEHYYELGRTEEAGIEHTLLPELGLIAPGALIAGGDSHTCTYGAFGALVRAHRGIDEAVHLLATRKKRRDRLDACDLADMVRDRQR